MARIPQLDPSVSPRIGSDPGVRFTAPPRYAETIAQGAEALRSKLVQTQEAERQQARRSAKLNLQRDLNQWMMDNRDGNEPETLPQRYQSFYEERRGHYSSTVSDADREEFTQLSDLASQDYENKVQTLALSARNDRLLANANGDVRNIVDTFSVTDNPAQRGQLLTSGFETYDNLRDHGVISDVEHEKLTSALTDDALNGLAARALEQDPQALMNIDADPVFEAMDQGDRLTWKIKAETEIERRQREAEAEANRRQREFLTDFDAYANALSSGVRSSPVLDAQFSDSRIEAAVRDPELQRVVKAQRDLAVVAQQDVSVLASGSPEEQAAYRDAVAAEAGAEVSSVSGATIATMQGQRLASIEAAMSKISAARSSDPAGTAARFNEGVKARFDEWQEEPSPEAYQDYKTALDQVYTQQGYPLGSAILPKGVASGIVNSVNSQWATDPEKAASQLDQMAQTMGNDWSRGFSELIAEGMAPEAAAVGWVSHSPALQQSLVSIGQNGGMKALKETVPQDLRNTVDDEITEGLDDFRRAAGGENRLFTGSMQEAAKILAYDMVARGMDETEAARTALSEVMDANFTVVNDSYIQGVVDPGAIPDEDALGIGAQVWIGAHVGLPDSARPEVPQDVPYTVTQADGGEWVVVPRKAGGATLSEEQAVRAASRAGYVDPVSKEALPRFASEAEAVAAIPGMGTQQLPEPEQLIDIDLSMYEDRLPPGLRSEDGQEIARKIIANSARLVLTPDGKNAVLVTGAFGLSDEVIGADGNPITVPVEELMTMGATRRKQLQTQGKPVVRQPGAQGETVQQKIMEFQGQGVAPQPGGPGEGPDVRPVIEGN